MIESYATKSKKVSIDIHVHECEGLMSHAFLAMSVLCKSPRFFKTSAHGHGFSCLFQKEQRFSIHQFLNKLSKHSYFQLLKLICPAATDLTGGRRGCWNHLAGNCAFVCIVTHTVLILVSCILQFKYIYMQWNDILWIGQ